MPSRIQSQGCPNSASRSIERRGAECEVNLAGGQCNFGNLLIELRKPTEALAWYGRAIATLEGVLEQVKTDVTVQRFLRNSHAGRATAFDHLNRSAEAATDWDKAMELTPEKEQASLRMGRAASRVRAGQVDAALKEVDKLVAGADADSLYGAACVYALAAAAPGLSPEARREKYARRAVALLQQAIAKGYNHVAHAKQDSDFDSLRKREDFQQFMRDWEKKAKTPPAKP